MEEVHQAFSQKMKQNVGGGRFKRKLHKYLVFLQLLLGLLSIPRPLQPSPMIRTAGNAGEKGFPTVRIQIDQLYPNKNTSKGSSIMEITASVAH